MRSKRCATTFMICCLFFFCTSFAYTENADDPRQGLEGMGFKTHLSDDLDAWGSDPREDTADVVIQYTTAYPGSEDYLVAIWLKNPVGIAGFDFEIIISPPDLADFSTVRVFADSIDTCPAPEETCWYFFPVRECLIQRGPWLGDWNIFEAHGAVGDTTSPACDTLWTVGITFGGTPIPPQPGYIPFLYFGVDVSCVPDSLLDRTISFDFTGHLSNELGQLVPFRAIPGKLDIWWSVPGDASADSLVDLGDVVFLVNYLYKDGPEPCIIEAADPNADCEVDLGDVVYLINFLFKGDSPPEPGCAH